MLLTVLPLASNVVPPVSVSVPPEGRISVLVVLVSLIGFGRGLPFSSRVSGSGAVLTQCQLIIILSLFMTTHEQQSKESCLESNPFQKKVSERIEHRIEY